MKVFNDMHFMNALSNEQYLPVLYYYEQINSLLK